MPHRKRLNLNTSRGTFNQNYLRDGGAAKCTLGFVHGRPGFPAKIKLFYST